MVEENVKLQLWFWLHSYWTALVSSLVRDGSQQSSKIYITQKRSGLGLWDGSAGENVCVCARATPTWCPELDLLTHGGRKESTPESCALASTCILCMFTPAHTCVCTLIHTHTDTLLYHHHNRNVRASFLAFLSCLSQTLWLQTCGCYWALPVAGLERQM